MYSFSNQLDANNNEYIEVLFNSSTIRIDCNLFRLQRIINPDADVFILTHNTLYQKFTFTRSEVLLPVSSDDLDLHEQLTDIFNCCSCAAVCDPECYAPQGLRAYYFVFDECNELNSLEEPLLVGGIGIGFGDCGGSCGFIMDDIEITVTDALDFATQIANYLNSNPYLGFNLAWVNLNSNNSVRLTITDSYDLGCCDENVVMWYNPGAGIVCDEGILDPSCFHPSPNTFTCCAGPIPCTNELVFDFTSWATGAYTPQTFYVSTTSDCFIQILGTDNVAALYTPTGITTYFYNAFIANIGMGSGSTILGVTQTSSTTITIEMSAECCGIDIYLGSNNAAFHNELANLPTTQINCCP